MGFGLRLRLAGFGFGVLVACGGGQAPPAGPSAAPSAGDVGAPSAAAPSASASAAQPSEASVPERRRKPFSIHSSCGDVVTVAFGSDPGAATAGRRTLAPGGSIEGPRGESGEQTVWLLDAAGAPLVKVHVTRGMSQVDVGKSCRTLDAH